MPVHFTAFHPDCELRDLPRTGPAALAGARRIARAAGLRFVYEGNVAGAGGHTDCPGCGAALVRRSWHEVLENRIVEGRCPRCRQAIARPLGERVARGGPMRTRLLVTAAVLVVAAAVLIIALTPRPTAKAPIQAGKEATVSLTLTSPAFAAAGRRSRSATPATARTSRRRWPGPALRPARRASRWSWTTPTRPIRPPRRWSGSTGCSTTCPAATTALPAGAHGAARCRRARARGSNDWKRTGYGGPCPPIGRHRYFHKLYALDIVLPDLNRPTRAALEKAMAGHVLAQTELVGTYQRSR